MINSPAAAPGTHQPSLDEMREEHPTLGFHQDSKGQQHSIEYRPAPGFTLKAGYCKCNSFCVFFRNSCQRTRCADLTDTSDAGMGNTWIVPGRHMEPKLEEMPEGIGQPRGAMPFSAPANSCCIFDRRLWHAVSP